MIQGNILLLIVNIGLALFTLLMIGLVYQNGKRKEFDYLVIGLTIYCLSMVSLLISALSNNTLFTMFGFLLISLSFMFYFYSFGQLYNIKIAQPYIISYNIITIILITIVHLSAYTHIVNVSMLSQ